jgi:cation diffusion facilitator family transporter
MEARLSRSASHAKRGWSERRTLAAYAWLSVATALATMALKAVAWWLTGSVGLLSDALESSVNLAAAVMALTMLHVAARPPDEEHAYGYSKAEYFSSGFEGALIFLAAFAIAVAAVKRLVEPQPLERLGIGLAITTGASLLNLVTARVLMRAGRGHDSIALEADGHHLMTDVYTSAGVVLALFAVWLTGWQRLDPIIALAVAVNILRIGYQLMKRSALGLLDNALPAPQRAAIAGVLEGYKARGVQFHALRTRQAAGRSFVSMHVLVPGAWSVQRGHDMLEKLERDVRDAVPGTSVFTHLEPIEDPASFMDGGLDRDDPA